MTKLIFFYLGYLNTSLFLGAFQFGGATAFGVTGSNNSNVFTFGGGSGGTASPAASPAMPAQPAAPAGGFGFSQSPAFNIG